MTKLDYNGRRRWGRGDAGVLKLGRLTMWVCFLFAVSVAMGQDAVPGIVKAMKSGQFDQVIALCHAAQKISPSDPRLWTLEGIAQTHLQQFEQALLAFDRALKLDPRSLPALEGAAELEYKQGNRRAIPLLERILAIRPDDPTTHAMLAVMQYKDKECARAVENFEQAAAATSNQPLALTQYGFCLTELNRFEESVPVFEQVIRLRPGAPNGRYNLALAQWKANHPTDALATLQPLLESGNPDADLLRLAAEMNDSAGNIPEAVELYRKAIQADPRNPQSYLGFAALSLNHEAFQAGIDMIDFGLTQIPQAAPLYLARGILFGALSKFDQATADFQHADQLDPHLAFSSAAQGVLHTQQRNLGAAVASFRAEAKRHPNDALAQYLLAEALAEQGNPKDSAAYKEEIAAANQALRLNPQLTAAHDLLSTVYLHNRQANLAIEQSRAALRTDPNDQAAVYHLILALRETDQKDQIPSLIKRLGELRRLDQAAASQKKRYQLAITPIGEPTGTAPGP
jgi:tetratricopeptide (TPR) repeat protein